VRGDDRPSVGQGADVGRAEVEHRLDGEDEAYLQRHSTPGLPVVGNLRLLVWLPADAVSHQVANDAVARFIRWRLNGRADITESVAGANLLDPEFEGGACDVEEVRYLGRDVADRDGDRG